MKFWGITGGIGAGKSQVLADLAQRGFAVLDADEVARRVVDPTLPEGKNTLAEIAGLAGRHILRSDGSLDRAGLRSWISQGDVNRAALEKILHPRIRAEILVWMDERRKSPGPRATAFIEASRMIESGLHKILDGVLWVTAPRAQRLERAVRRDARSLDEIAALADLQLPDDAFAAHATETVVNSGNLEELKSSVTKFLSRAALVMLVAMPFMAPGVGAADSQEWFPSGRARSMGMALTAIVDDHDSLHTNPAGLALVETSTLRLPDLLMASFSSSFTELLKKFRELDGDAGASIAQQLSSFDGTAAGAELALLSMYWNRPRLGLAINPLGVTGAARVRTPSLLFAKVDVFAAVQGGVTLGYGHPMLGNRLRVGFALKPFSYRLGLKAELQNQDIMTLSERISEYGGAGWGVDADFGVQGNLDPLDFGGGAGLKLMGGAVLQNTFANKFGLSLAGTSRGNPPPMERRLNVGVAARVLNPGVLEPTLSVEFRDILTSYDEFLEFFHMGFELLMRPRDFYTSALRLGLAKGNLSGGIAFQWQIFELEIGSYAVNLGPGPGIGRDRRYYIQTALEF